MAVTHSGMQGSNEIVDGQIKAGMTKKQQGNERLYMQDNGQDIMVLRTSHVCLCLFPSLFVALKQAEIYYRSEWVGVCVCVWAEPKIIAPFCHSATWTSDNYSTLFEIIDQILK